MRKPVRKPKASPPASWSGKKKSTKQPKTLAKKRQVKGLRIMILKPEPTREAKSDLKELDQQSDVLKQKLERLQARRDKALANEGWSPVVKKMNKRAQTLSNKLANISMKIVRNTYLLT